MTTPEAAAVRHITIHGHRVAYRQAGAGPVVVLVHGIAESSLTFADVVPALAEHHLVIAVDLLGHGASAKPRGDYSLGAYASGVRDLLSALDHPSATVVGHSLGGGVAMQFAYQFPERCERLVLVSSGGLGKEVSPWLRLLAGPGVDYVLPVVLTRHVHEPLDRAARWLGRLGLRVDPTLAEIWRTYRGLTDAEAQRAFLHTVRSVIDVAGQRVSARDRLYLASEIPTMIVWGDRDAVIPVAHARAAHELIPGSRLEVFEGVGHFLPVEQPARLAALIADFVATTEAGSVTPDRWQRLLVAGATVPPVGNGDPAGSPTPPSTP
ncbi:MAG TPA: alpha/beta fold hydrolase [Acidimicrobiales bacterium]|nr:alpha/beta fold hydrolase [Acidimicrobiales bacterium]